MVIYNIQAFSSVQSLSRVRLFATPWTAARQASLSINTSQSLLKLMSIESVMPSDHLILCRPLLLPPSIFPQNYKNEVKVKSLSCVQLFATLWTIAHQVPPSMEFSRQEYWSGLPFPSPSIIPHTYYGFRSRPPGYSECLDKVKRWFGFPAHRKVTSTFECSLLSMQQRYVF